MPNLLYDMTEALHDTITRLRIGNIKHEIHRFESGCVMIDVWKDDKFYCLQFEDCKLGLSLVPKDTDFGTIPDKWYNNLSEFKTDLETIL